MFTTTKSARKILLLSSEEDEAITAATTKERITIRLTRSVVDQFRATGDGWQTRLDAALLDWLKDHSPAR
jgi:uncharacterized protein (DUF4415 family)